MGINQSYIHVLLLWEHSAIFVSKIFLDAIASQGLVLLMSLSHSVTECSFKTFMHVGNVVVNRIVTSRVEFARFPVRILGYRAYFTFKKFHILVVMYDLPDYGALVVL